MPGGSRRRQQRRHQVDQSIGTRSHDHRLIRSSFIGDVGTGIWTTHVFAMAIYRRKIS